MGAGIAYICSLAGYTVTIQDIDSKILEKSREQREGFIQHAFSQGKITRERGDRARENITERVDMGQAVSEADLIIEAITEDLPTK